MLIGIPDSYNVHYLIVSNMGILWTNAKNIWIQDLDQQHFPTERKKKKASKKTRVILDTTNMKTKNMVRPNRLYTP